MIAYATNDTICRSRQLLRYFGEESTHDCRQCDVCLAHKGTTSHDAEASLSATQRILTLLADRQPHHMTELHSLNIPKDRLDPPSPNCSTKSR